ncbi:CGNR zinc finger domain-containing protein [Micromonospora sp. NPDC050417]|uniref:CGNR zinc finger domain-containing protein n=1 Tax=Micromonospora sp. NPDC050417 TaxID=3364280 RepID=UPI0037B17278
MIGVLRLAHPDGQVFGFDAGALCLELACGTGGEGFRARFERLHTPTDFVVWSALSRLDPIGHGVDPDDIPVQPSDLTEVKRLREAIWSIAVAATGQPVPYESTEPGLATGAARLAGLEREFAVVNEVAGGPPVVPQFGSAGGTPVWRRPVDARQLITEIARDAVRTFSAPTVDRVRMCAGQRCALVYLDTSRPGQRRWCSMQRCGNRNKVADHRRRRQGAPEQVRETPA